jgi:hypothetical protein
MDVVVVIVIIVPPPTVLVVFIVLGYLAPRVRTLGAVIKLVGPANFAGAMERTVNVGAVAPVLTVAALSTQRARVWVMAVFPGVFARLPAPPFLTACAAAKSFIAVA